MMDDSIVRKSEVGSSSTTAAVLFQEISRQHPRQDFWEKQRDIRQGKVPSTLPLWSDAVRVVVEIGTPQRFSHREH